MKVISACITRLYISWSPVSRAVYTTSEAENPEMLFGFWHRRCVLNKGTILPALHITLNQHRLKFTLDSNIMCASVAIESIGVRCVEEGVKV